MQNSRHNSIDFEALMQELQALEQSFPDHPDIPTLKAKVQKELDRQKNAAISNAADTAFECTDSENADSSLQSQEIFAVLDSLYASAEANQQASAHSKSSHHHSSHRSSHHSSSSRSGRRHRRHTVIPKPSSIPTEGINYEDLIYSDDLAATNTSGTKKTSKAASTATFNNPVTNRTTHVKKNSEGGSDTHVSNTADPLSKKDLSSNSSVSSPISAENKRNSCTAKTGVVYKKDMRGWKSLRTWQKTVAVAFGIILLIVLAGSFSVNQFMNRINRVDPDEIPELSKEGYEDLFSLSQEELEAMRESDPDVESLIIDKKDRYGVGSIDITPMQRDDVLNILLIGQDRRTGDKGQMRSDSMILVTIDKTSKEMKLTSLMRDMYVPVPGYGYGMINATLLNGGMKLLNATIEQNFGVHIDGDIQIDFYRFIKLMDLVGPLGLELNAEEVKYFKETNGWNFKVGYNELNSEQVLAYARTRSVGRSDWERTDRQRKVIMAIYSQLKKSDIPSLMKFTYDAMPLITTNINKNTDLINIVYTILSNRMPITKSSRIPLEGTYTQQIKTGLLHVLVPELWPNVSALQKIVFG